MHYADLDNKSMFICAYVGDKNRPQPKQLFTNKTKPKKLKPLFLHLKPTETESAN